MTVTHSCPVVNTLCPKTGNAADEFLRSVALWVALSHVRLADNSSAEVIEAALKGVLELDLRNVQARHSMQVLLRNLGRWVEGRSDP